MLRRVSCLLILTACAALPAWADGDDVMAGYVGNTVVQTGGQTDTDWEYGADHSFVMKVPQYGAEFKGTWAMQDKTTLCRTFETALPGMPNPLCSPVEAHMVGDSWTVTNKEGQTITASLVEGLK